MGEYDKKAKKYEMYYPVSLCMDYFGPKSKYEILPCVAVSGLFWTKIKNISKFFPRQDRMKKNN